MAYKPLKIRYNIHCQFGLSIQGKGCIMGVNQEGGTSVYTVGSLERRMQYPIHQAARELVRRYSRTGRVLDIGCSDLVTTRLLVEEGFQIFGIDLDPTALAKANREVAAANLICADITRLPIADISGIDAVIILDVLEHLKPDDAVGVLKTLHAIGPSVTVVVSMPILSVYSVGMWIELVRLVARGGKRPKTGLLDRTHQILLDSQGHNMLFQSAGFRVAEQYATHWIKGVTGRWETVTPQPFKYPVRGFIYRTATEQLPRLVHPHDSAMQLVLSDRIAAYQGLYLLRPLSERALDLAAVPEKVRVHA